VFRGGEQNTELTPLAVEPFTTDRKTDEKEEEEKKGSLFN